MSYLGLLEQKIIKDNIETSKKQQDSAAKAALDECNKSIKVINDELQGLDDQQLKALLKQINAGLKISATAQQTAEFVSCIAAYGKLTAAQRAQLTSNSSAAAAIADGIGGLIIPINYARTFITVCIISISKTLFLVATGIAMGLAIICSSLLIYSLFKATNGAREELIKQLQVVNAKQRIWVERLQKNQLIINDKLLELLIRLNEYSASDSTLAAKLEKLPQFSTADSDETKQANLKILREFFNQTNNRNELLQILRKTAVEQSELDEAILTKNANTTKAETSIDLDKLAADKNFSKRAFAALTNAQYTLPVITAAGISFAMFAFFGLGSVALLTTSSTALGISTLAAAALTLSGPYGLAILAVISVAVGAYFGYRYFRKFKEAQVLKQNIAEVEKATIDLKTQFSANKALQQELQIFEQCLVNITKPAAQLGKEVSQLFVPEQPSQQAKVDFIPSGNKYPHTFFTQPDAEDSAVATVALSADEKNKLTSDDNFTTVSNIFIPIKQSLST